MPRPYVNIEGPNLAPEYLNAALHVLPQFIKMDGVIGVTLNGGVSRGYADALSEIDLTVYFESNAYEKLQAGKAPVPFGITVLDGQLFDLKIANICEEEQSDWESVKLWDASYAQILYDPDGRIAALLDDKLRNKPVPGAAGGAMFSCWWCFKLAGDIWLKRGDILQGHLMMNEALKYLLTALFLLNREYIPHEKWLVHLSRTLEWTPPSWAPRLASAMLPQDASAAGLAARQEVIAALWSDLDAHLCALSGLPTGLSFRQQCLCRQLRHALAVREMTCQEFDRLTGLAFLKYSPFHELFRLESGMVIFDETALRALTPDQLYVWQYEIIDALRKI